MSDAARQKLSSALRARAVINELQELEQIEERLPALEEELRTLNASLLPQKEIAARLLADLRQHRDEFERLHLSTYDYGSAAMRLVYALNHDTPHRLTIDEKDTVALLVWLLFPVIEPNVAPAVNRLGYTPGPGCKERASRRAALEQEHATLLARHEVVVEAVRTQSEGTVVVQHLEANAQRRETEARRAQLNEAHKEISDARPSVTIRNTNGL